MNAARPRPVLTLRPVPAALPTWVSLSSGDQGHELREVESPPRDHPALHLQPP